MLAVRRESENLLPQEDVFLLAVFENHRRDLQPIDELLHDHRDLIGADQIVDFFLGSLTAFP